MIKIIYGSKGSGKTKRIIEEANNAVSTAKGSVVYITDNNEHAKKVNSAIRFVLATTYEIDCDCCFNGFVNGLIAGNYDLEVIYIDRIGSFLSLKPDQLVPVVEALDEISLRHQVDFVLTVSCDQLPEGMAKFASPADCV